MKVDIKVPQMGESVIEATISNILKESGSSVREDEELLELETDKVNQVIYAPKSGVLTLKVSKGQVVKIGEVIGSIETTQTAIAPTASAPKKESAPPASVEMRETARFTTRDFAAAAKEKKEEAPSPAPLQPVKEKKLAAPGKAPLRTPMSKVRKVIAERLVAAKNSTAMLTTFNEIDMSAVMEIRQKEKESFLKKYGVKLGFMSFFVKGAVAALKEFPLVNSMIDAEEIVTFQTYDIGIAVSTERGLLVPVVKECDLLSFGAIEQSIEQHAKVARTGTISVDALKGGSFTITNGGTFGSLLSTPILNPPQSAILGMHAIVKRPVVVDDAIVIRPMMYVALSYDHRIVDGREAVLFLVSLKKALEEPSRLLLDL